MELQFKNLKKSYGEKEILHGLNFTVHSGRPMAFLGRNGAGKTTTIRTLMGVFRQDEGEILLDGSPIDRTKYRFGYLPEERGLYAKDQILKQLIYFGSLRGGGRKETKRSAVELLEKVGLEEHKNDKLETLSKGNQQKVQIVQTLLNDPEIIVLDEPFSGLDPVNAGILIDLIKEYIEKDRIILFSSHQMSYVEDICDDLTLLENGRVVLTGGLEDIQKRLGKNRVRLASENTTDQDLKELLSGYAVEEDPRSLIVDLGGEAPEDFLRRLLNSNIVPSLFSAYKPSVADIFVNYVKETDHEELV